MISTVPCGATVQAPPDYIVCTDCQGIRALCGVTPCPHAPPFTAPRLSPEGGTLDEDAFKAWLEAGGRKPSTAENITAAALNAVRAGARCPDDVTPALFPGLKEGTIEKYRQALVYFTAWKRGDAPSRGSPHRSGPRGRSPVQPHNQEPVVPVAVDVYGPTITLDIPVAWVDSATVDRHGYRIAIDVVDDTWLTVGEETYRRAVEALKTEMQL